MALKVKLKIMVYSIEVFSERRLVFHQGPSVKTETHLSELGGQKSRARFQTKDDDTIGFHHATWRKKNGKWQYLLLIGYYFE